MGRIEPLINPATSWLLPDIAEGAQFQTNSWQRDVDDKYGEMGWDAQRFKSGLSTQKSSSLRTLAPLIKGKAPRWAKDAIT
tara:strand:- start:49 stop:291 length:243 start_codon:yes stop_codon:yes gene_type:complete